MKYLVNKIEKFLIGKIALQPFYESLHRISIRGMNYMQSQDIHETGEIGAMRFAHSKKPNGTVVIFDVGANKGQFASEVTKVFKEDFKLYSFEPSSKIYNVLEEKFKNKGNVETYQFGFGRKKREINLFDTGDLIGSIYPLDSSSKEFESIVLLTVDEFCYEKNISEIFYLKIDVEGAELDVLKGAKALVESDKVHFVQFEFGPNHMKANVYLKDFFEVLKNYNIYRIVKDGLRPIKEYNELLEIPICGNFFAENKKIANVNFPEYKIT